jgi:abortive infection bacteriophage resistance protein
MNRQRQFVYKKPPLSIDSQIQLLRDRGLIVDDDVELRYFLKNISYYHLSIYFKLFQTYDIFHEGTKFSDIVRVYIFDNKLRFLLLEVLERVEKSFKARTVYNLSIRTGLSHPHLSVDLFRDLSVFNEIQQMFMYEFERSKEISIAHYRYTYTEPVLPPIWTLTEILSFGQIVKFMKSLKREYRNAVARTFKADEQFVLSWMHSLSALRNNCAHHTRLWNKENIFYPTN